MVRSAACASRTMRPHSCEAIRRSIWDGFRECASDTMRGQRWSPSVSSINAGFDFREPVSISSVIPGQREALSPESIAPNVMAYYVYLPASDKYGTLYLGMTNDIVRHTYEHKSKLVAAFTKRYSIDKLVWFEIYDDALTAIAREKELKKWRRDWKIRLIEESNP